MDLITSIERDFPKNEHPYLPRDDHTIKMIWSIAEQFTNFDDFTKFEQIKHVGKTIHLIDTCSIIKKDLSNFEDKHLYVITCGVFLEILQGATRKTLEDGSFTKDINKIIQLKSLLGNSLVFLMLGRRRRAYWNGYEPSKSCRNCINNDRPHYKILRDIDTELYRLSLAMNWELDTCDHHLMFRKNKYKKMTDEGQFNNPKKHQHKKFNDDEWKTVKTR
jgi:hypothetical protein